MVCQSFKDTGKFYYGMDVDRCIGVVRSNPLAPRRERAEAGQQELLKPITGFSDRNAGGAGGQVRPMRRRSETPPSADA